MVYNPGPEPKRYYDWILWKLRQDPQWRENYEYSKSRRKEERAKRIKFQEEIVKMDMAELTKSYYALLKRNKELVEENETLKNKLSYQPLSGPHYRQIFNT